MALTVGVIVNPTSGKGKGGKSAPELGTLLHRRGIDAALLVAGSADEALAMARKAVADGVDAIVAAGGDGTINLAVQAVAGTDTPLAVIPLGTGNDNARLLGLPLDDLEKCVDVIADFTVRSIDLGHVVTADGSERYFLGVLSSGFDSCVNERANVMTWPKGEARAGRRGTDPHVAASGEQVRVPSDFPEGLQGDPRDPPVRHPTERDHHHPGSP